MRSLLRLLLVLWTLTPLVAAQTTIFSEDFENGLGRWSVTSLWHLTDESDPCMAELVPFPSSDSCAAFNNGFWVNCDFGGAPQGYLTMATPVTIPATAHSARLRYKSWEETECGGPNCGWDDRYVQVSSDGGPFQVIALGMTEGVWHERSVALDDYIGHDVIVRFRFHAVDSWFNSYLGWMLDDVEIEIDTLGTGYCSGKRGSSGCIPYVEASGDPSLAGPDDLLVSGHFLVNQVVSKLVWSRAPNSMPFHGGTLCVRKPAARTPIASSGGSALPARDCTGVYAWNFSHAYLASKGVVAGDTIYVQASTRDPGFAPPTNHGLSNAVAITILP